MPAMFQSMVYNEIVLPPVRKVRAQMTADWVVPTEGYQVQDVSLDEASGGFNSVVEIAASYCFRIFKDAVTPSDLQRRLRGRRFLDFLNDTGHSLPTFNLGHQATIVADEYYYLIVNFTAVSFRFQNAREVCIIYQGSLQLEGAGEPFAPSVPFLGSFGLVELKVCFDYQLNIHNQTKQVDILADMSTTTFEWTPGSNLVNDVFDEFLTSDKVAVQNGLLSHSDVLLAPRISLVGRNPTNILVTEINRFEVEVSHVESEIDDTRTQAIVIAFNIRPGVNGVIGDIQHFIGDHDYGVILDEYLLERVFKHKWRIGGFLRQLSSSKRITIKRDGNNEDAILEGIMTLESLNSVVVDTDSSTRTDFIRMGGSATTKAQRIRLYDGTIIGPNEIDFGSPHGHPWSVVTSLSTDPNLSADAELRQFQEVAHNDGYQHVSRPFRSNIASGSGIDIACTRIEGVTKQILVLGRMNRLFS